MLSPALGRFLSRDPLPEQGQPDVLYDNNEFGDWLTWMRNTYGYVENNPLNDIDPSGLKGQGHHPGRPVVPRPGKPQVCGFYAWLYAGSGVIPNLAFCVDKDVYDAAINAGGRVVNCWLDCEGTIHKSALAYGADACGAAATISFTHVEFAKGAVRQGIGTPGDVTTAQSALALWLAQQGYKGSVQQLLRSSAQAVSKAPLSAGVKSGVAGVAIVEAGFSIYCGWKCS